MSEKERFEARDVRWSAIAAVAAGVIVLCLGVQVVLIGLFHHWERRAPERVSPYTDAAEQASIPPEPRLQADPPADLAALRRRDAAVLETYGWADRARGVVRLPIGRAMELLVAQGLPDRDNPDRNRAAGGEAGKTEVDMRRERGMAGE